MARVLPFYSLCWKLWAARFRAACCVGVFFPHVYLQTRLRGYLVSGTRAVYCGNIRSQRDAPAAAFVRAGEIPLLTVLAGGDVTLRAGRTCPAQRAHSQPPFEPVPLLSLRYYFWCSPLMQIASNKFLPAF
jgi:hypothetical protein